VNQNIPIVSNDNFSYEAYKDIVNKYIEKDSRELNFQNRAILVMLETILINTDVEVVDTSILYDRGKRNSPTLKNRQFAAKGSGPPDLLLVRNWHLNNRDNTVEYLAAIEVKSPSSMEAISGKEVQNYDNKTIQQVLSHLSLSTIPVVILTDSCRWHFLREEEDLNNASLSFDLLDENKHWKKETIEIDDTLGDILDLKGQNNTIEKEPKEWDDIKNAILDVVKGE